MAYLQHLKDIYKNNYMDRLKCILESDCKYRLISEVFNVNIQKIKKYIEEKFEEQIFFTDKYDETIQINLSTIMLKTDTNEITKYFMDKTYYPLFEKHLEDDEYGDELQIFIENLAPFQAIKQEIERELDGLEFDFNFAVSVRDKKILSVEIQPMVYFSSEGFERNDSEDD